MHNEVFLLFTVFWEKNFVAAKRFLPTLSLGKKKEKINYIYIYIYIYIFTSIRIYPLKKNYINFIWHP